ncbi:metallophosphoesterase family protein [Microbulbifer sp. S227A]|uniref:metallophosphoesterase family protein n=1 Tax=Microbulbifer sp. S227A TaxID=3415131 RepID=UPI003C7CBC2B
MTQPVYAIGDIHGQIGFLETALDLIAADGGEDAQIVFLGDLVDRGPDSRAVIQRLFDGQAAGRNWRIVKGNHDRMFHRFVTGAIEHDARILSGLGWLHPRLGGLATLASYGVDVETDQSPQRLFAEAQQAVPRAHLDYVNNLPLYIEHEELLFVHAGVAPGVALQDQIEDDLVWIREPFLSHADPHPWLVVHGHTALDIPFHFGNRIDLDGGAGYGRPLVPAVFEGRDCWLLTKGGRMRLTP